MANTFDWLIYSLVLATTVAAASFDYNGGDEETNMYRSIDGNRYTFHKLNAKRQIELMSGSNQQQQQPTYEQHMFPNEHSGQQTEYYRDDPALRQQQLHLLQQPRQKEYEQHNDYCLYANIRSKMSDCFGNSTDCR